MVIIIGISGGSCSGKTKFAQKLFNKISKNGLLLSQDSFYKGLNSEELKDVDNYNFDIPEAIDFELISDVINGLNNNRTVRIPIYDFKTHTRIGYKTQEPQNIDILVIEGITIFCDQVLRELMDLKIFIDTDADIRIIRRIERDVKERGRTMDMVINRYKKFVKPSHDKYIETSKKYANIIIPKGADNFESLEFICKLLN